MNNIRSGIFLALVSVVISTPGQQSPVSPGPLKEVQNQLNTILDQESTDAIDRGIASLTSSADRTTAELIPQVLYYQLALKKDEQKLWRSVYVLRSLIDGNKKGDIIEALLPHLGAGDNNTKRRFFKVLDALFYSSEQQAYNFVAVEPLLRKYQERIAVGLVDYLYDRAPGEAFLSFVNALATNEAEKRKLLTKAQPVFALLAQRPTSYQRAKAIDPETIRKLEDLSKEEAWWVQLLVAESAVRCRSFRKNAILDGARSVANPAIQQRVKRCVVSSGREANPSSE